jgi:hypothetical protein
MHVATFLGSFQLSVHWNTVQHQYHTTFLLSFLLGHERHRGYQRNRYERKTKLQIFHRTLFFFPHKESIKWVEVLSVPVLILSGLGLFIWAWARGGTFGEILAASNELAEDSSDSTTRVFFIGLTAMVASWATLSLNMTVTHQRTLLFS